MELDHVFHPEHKLTYDEVVKSANGEVCAACLGQILSKCYSCGECSFFLHKLCAERPERFTHSFHPHLLQLLPKNPYSNKDAGCDECKRVLGGFVYHCKICQFDLDFMCAFPDGSKLNHVCHSEHVLTYENVVEKADSGLVCAACVEEIAGPFADYYSCRECNFFLHKLCADRPTKFTHSLHPKHPLQVLPKNPYSNADASCNACYKVLEGFVYICLTCDFILDYKCAFPDKSKLNHVCHPTHVLTYENVVQRADKGVVCAACLGEISGRFVENYSCRPCNFFLHKLCAERPSEFTHSLHPSHPLQLLPKKPYSNENAPCDCCKKTLEGFVYHCTICNFDLDFICSFPDGLKINHVCHPDHVLTFEKVARKADDKGVVCAACLGEISGRSTEYYSCRPCNLFLHKLCAKQPREFTHPLHPPHPLQLLPKTPYSDENANCDACTLTLKGFVYHCYSCNFDLDFICSLSDESKLNHISHRDHTLTLENLVKKADKGVVCKACREELTGPLADYYSCRPCNFFLHKLCAQRPVWLYHPLHPQHPLELLHYYPFERNKVACYGCQKELQDFIYGCTEYDFYLDFACVFPKLEKRIQNFEQLHHHPLISQAFQAKFSCDICSSSRGDEDEDEEDQSYTCSTCDFWIHKSCADDTLNQRYKDHQHPLSLVRGVPEDLQIYGRYYCNVCGNLVGLEDLVSCCFRCRFFVHVRCMVTDEVDLITSIKDDVDYMVDSFFKHLLRDDEFISVRWPPKDVSSDLIQPFLLEKNGIVMDVQPKIRHFSHKQHDMILFQELCVNNDSFFKEEDDAILCDGCIHPITAPYYCCEACSYYLHLACANLPDQIKHSSHDEHQLHILYLTYEMKYSCHDEHQLRLTSRWIFDRYRCYRCDRYCNGFGYECLTCGFALDLKCAAFPFIIILETHDHPLFQMKAHGDLTCNACNRAYIDGGDSIFACKACDVYISYSCAMLSSSIRHRWDRQHPLLLRCPPHGDHPEDFMCDMCEEIINPKNWLYSCFQCDVSFHLHCEPSRRDNIKFGAKIKIRSHPHILTYLRRPTFRTTCAKCKGLISFQSVFECETCYYYCICYDCAMSKLRHHKH